jgi:small subunit ribosomal protein S17
MDAKELRQKTKMELETMVTELRADLWSAKPHARRALKRDLARLLTVLTTQTITKSRRHLRGIVVSAKMAKTVVIQIDRRVPHPKYGKYYTKSTTLKVHDEKGAAKVGDLIEVEETRPLSKDKRFRYVSTIKAA